MAIIQISKVQQRSGNLVDLPQLDQGEFGWASDYGKLYIGKTATGANIENVEVLTSYSNISFSQIDGAEGNLNISNSAANGQVLAYNGSDWVNAGGNASDISNSSQWSSQPIHLGNVSTVKIGGGGIGYVLETDGTGNLSWTPKGTLYSNIIAISSAVSGIMTVANTIPYVNGLEVTITGVQGTNANTVVNGQSFYVKLATNFNTSGNVELYTDSGLTTPLDTTTLTATANTGIAIAVLSSGSGGANAAGAANSIQFNNSGVLDGSANLTFSGGTLLALTGNANITGNVNVTGNVTSSRLISNIATGTAPLTVTSTTRVSNLNVTYANVSDFAVVATQTTGTFYPVFVNANTNANYALNSNANIAFNAATGNLSVTILNANSNITGGNLSTGGTLSVTGNANIGNIGSAGLLTVTGNITGGNIITAGVVSATGNANVGNLGTVGVFATTLSATGNANVGNIGTTILTATGAIQTSTTLSAVGNANVGNLGTAGLITATGNINGGNINTAGVVSATGNVTGGNVLTAGVVSATGNVTGGNLVTGGVLSVTGNANVGNIGATNIVGTLTTASQTNITAVGTLVNLSVTGNANIGNIGTAGLITATGNITGGNITTAGALNVTGNANIGNIGTAGLITASGNITGGNLITSGLISVTGNITAGNITLANAATVSGNNMTLTTGANTNLGTITGNWSLSTGSRLEATYADLAEYYQADKEYEPGTVLEFGGEREVTIASDATNRVAGVVSTNPAYAMNAKCPGIAVAIALQGRVPCKVRGLIRKGDMMISGGNGYARPSSSPTLGSVIGKALENFEGAEGVIEIAIGRL